MATKKKSTKMVLLRLYLYAAVLFSCMRGGTAICKVNNKYIKVAWPRIGKILDNCGNDYTKPRAYWSWRPTSNYDYKICQDSRNDWCTREMNGADSSNFDMERSYVEHIFFQCRAEWAPFQECRGYISASIVDCGCKVGNRISAHCSKDKDSECARCHDGQYGPDGKTCKFCPLGQENNRLGGGNGGGCRTCVHPKVRTATSTEACEWCPDGQERFTASTCRDCRAGEQSEGGLCHKCEKGFYQPAAGSDSCIQCGVGQYTDTVGATEPKLCPAGTFSTNPGGTGIDSCKPCPTGTFNDKEGKDTCTKCPVGSYQEKTNMTSPSACLPCPPGTVNDGLGASVCTPCASNMYQDLGGQMTCKECSAEGSSDHTGHRTRCKCKSGWMGPGCEENYIDRYNAIVSTDVSCIDQDWDMALASIVERNAVTKVNNYTKATNLIAQLAHFAEVLGSKTQGETTKIKDELKEKTEEAAKAAWACLSTQVPVAAHRHRSLLLRLVQQGLEADHASSDTYKSALALRELAPTIAHSMEIRLTVLDVLSLCEVQVTAAHMVTGVVRQVELLDARLGYLYGADASNAVDGSLMTCTQTDFSSPWWRADFELKPGEHLSEVKIGVRGQLIPATVSIDGTVMASIARYEPNAEYVLDVAKATLASIPSRASYMCQNALCPCGIFVSSPTGYSCKINDEASAVTSKQEALELARATALCETTDTRLLPPGTYALHASRCIAQYGDTDPAASKNVMKEVRRVLDHVEVDDDDNGQWFVDEAIAYIEGWLFDSNVKGTFAEMPLMGVEFLAQELDEMAGKTLTLADKLDEFERDATFTTMLQGGQQGILSYLNTAHEGLFSNMEAEKEAVTKLANAKRSFIQENLDEITNTIVDDADGAMTKINEANSLLKKLNITIDNALDNEYKCKEQVLEDARKNAIFGIFSGLLTALGGILPGTGATMALIGGQVVNAAAGGRRLDDNMQYAHPSVKLLTGYYAKDAIDAMREGARRGQQAAQDFHGKSRDWIKPSDDDKRLKVADVETYLKDSVKTGVKTAAGCGLHAITCARARLKDFDPNNPAQQAAYEGDAGEIIDGTLAIAKGAEALATVNAQLDNLEQDFDAQDVEAQRQLEQLRWILAEAFHALEDLQVALLTVASTGPFGDPDEDNENPALSSTTTRSTRMWSSLRTQLIDMLRSDMVGNGQHMFCGSYVGRGEAPPPAGRMMLRHRRLQECEDANSDNALAYKAAWEASKYRLRVECITFERSFANAMLDAEAAHNKILQWIDRYREGLVLGMQMRSSEELKRNWAEGAKALAESAATTGLSIEQQLTVQRSYHFALLRMQVGETEYQLREGVRDLCNAYKYAHPGGALPADSAITGVGIDIETCRIRISAVPNHADKLGQRIRKIGELVSSNNGLVKNVRTDVVQRQLSTNGAQFHPGKHCFLRDNQFIKQLQENGAATFEFNHVSFSGGGMLQNAEVYAFEAVVRDEQGNRWPPDDTSRNLDLTLVTGNKTQANMGNPFEMFKYWEDPDDTKYVNEYSYRSTNEYALQFNYNTNMEGCSDKITFSDEDVAGLPAVEVCRATYKEFLTTPIGNVRQVSGAVQLPSPFTTWTLTLNKGDFEDELDSVRIGSVQIELSLLATVKTNSDTDSTEREFREGSRWHRLTREFPQEGPTCGRFLPEDFEPTGLRQIFLANDDVQQVVPKSSTGLAALAPDSETSNMQFLFSKEDGDGDLYTIQRSDDGRYVNAKGSGGKWKLFWSTTVRQFKVLPSDTIVNGFSIQTSNNDRYVSITSSTDGTLKTKGSLDPDQAIWLLPKVIDNPTPTPAPAPAAGITGTRKIKLQQGDKWVIVRDNGGLKADAAEVEWVIKEVVNKNDMYTIQLLSSEMFANMFVDMKGRSGSYMLYLSSSPREWFIQKHAGSTGAYTIQANGNGGRYASIWSSSDDRMKGKSSLHEAEALWTFQEVFPTAAPLPQLSPTTPPSPTAPQPMAEGVTGTQKIRLQGGDWMMVGSVNDLLETGMTEDEWEVAAVTGKDNVYTIQRKSDNMFIDMKGSGKDYKLFLSSNPREWIIQQHSSGNGAYTIQANDDSGYYTSIWNIDDFRIRGYGSFKIAQALWTFQATSVPAIPSPVPTIPPSPTTLQPVAENIGGTRKIRQKKNGNWIRVRDNDTLKTDSIEILWNITATDENDVYTIQLLSDGKYVDMKGSSSNYLLFMSSIKETWLIKESSDFAGFYTIQLNDSNKRYASIWSSSDSRIKGKTSLDTNQALWQFL